MMISICWIHKGDPMQISGGFFLVLLSPLFYIIILFLASLVSLNSQLHLFISGFSLGCAWVPPPSAVAWKLCQGSKLGQSSGSLHLFFIFQDYCLSLSDVQCLENLFFMYFFYFLVILDSNVYLVSVTPSWLEAEV